MHLNVTIKNVSWPHFSWPTLYKNSCKQQNVSVKLTFCSNTSMARQRCQLAANIGAQSQQYSEYLHKLLIIILYCGGQLHGTKTKWATGPTIWEWTAFGALTQIIAGPMPLAPVMVLWARMTHLQSTTEHSSFRLSINKWTAQVTKNKTHTLL